MRAWKTVQHVYNATRLVLLERLPAAGTKVPHPGGAAGSVAPLDSPAKESGIRPDPPTKEPYAPPEAGAERSARGSGRGDEEAEAGLVGLAGLVERLGLKYVGPEKLYCTIYVQPLLAFNIKVGDGLHPVLVPDWLDWDPNAFFYQQVATPSRMALRQPLSTKVNTDGSPMLGGMKHLIKDLYREGAPHHISLTYIPKWKQAEIEAAIHELKARVAPGAVPPTKTAGEIRAEVAELERKAQACRRPVSVTAMGELALVQVRGLF